MCRISACILEQGKTRQEGGQSKTCFGRISGCLGATLGPLGLQVHEIAPLHLAEVGHDQVRVLGGDTGP